MSDQDNGFQGDDAGFLPPPITPPDGGKAYVAFEMGMAQEVQIVKRIQVGSVVFKASPLPSGPVAYDIDAPNGGTVRVIQADTLQALITGNVRVETWPLKAGDRLIKGLTPIRRFVVLVVEGNGMRVEPRPLGETERGPSVWKLAPVITVWAGV